MTKIKVDFQAGESRHGCEGVNYMLATVEVDGEEIELYEEVPITAEFIDADGDLMDSDFDDYSYPILKESIIEQAIEAGIDPEELEFYWD